MYDREYTPEMISELEENERLVLVACINAEGQS